MERARCAEQRLAVDYAFEKCEEENSLLRQSALHVNRALTQRLRTRTGSYITKFFHAVALFHEPDTRIQSTSVRAHHGMIAEDVSHFSLLQFMRSIESLLHSSNRWELILATLVRCISAQILVRVMTTTHGFAYLLRLFQWPWGILYSSRWENRTGF